MAAARSKPPRKGPAKPRLHVEKRAGATTTRRRKTQAFAGTEKRQTTRRKITQTSQPTENARLREAYEELKAEREAFYVPFHEQVLYYLSVFVFTALAISWVAFSALYGTG